MGGHSPLEQLERFGTPKRHRNTGTNVVADPTTNAGLTALPVGRCAGSRLQRMRVNYIPG